MDPSTEQQTSNLQVTVNEQPMPQWSMLPYHEVFPFLAPEVPPDKIKELHDMFDKYKRNEMSFPTFLQLMRGIVGDSQLLLSATASAHYYKIRYPPGTVNEQPRTRINVRVPLPYEWMLPFLVPEIDQDKANKLKALFDKYERNQISRDTLYRLMKDTVGKRLLLSAAAKVRQKSNLLVTTNKQRRTQINYTEQVLPFDQLFPFVISRTDPVKAIEIKALFHMYKIGEIAEHIFLPVMKGILGEQMLRIAEEKVKEQVVRVDASCSVDIACIWQLKSTEEQMSNLQVTVNEKPEINSRKSVVPYDRYFPLLIPQIHQDKVNALQSLFDKYKRDEIPRVTFYSLMTYIVGDEKLILSAAAKVHEQQKSNLPVTVNEQPSKRVPFNQLFHFLISQMDADKANEFRSLVHKYKRGEIPKYDFGPLMKGVVGEEKLRSAVATLKQQKRNLQVTGNEQPRTQINSSEPVLPFDQMIPFLIYSADPDNAIELQLLFGKFKRGEIAEHTFVAVMKGILGEQMLRFASRLVKQQKITNASSSVTSL